MGKYYSERKCRLSAFWLLSVFLSLLTINVSAQTEMKVAKAYYYGSSSTNKEYLKLSDYTLRGDFSIGTQWDGPSTKNFKSMVILWSIGDQMGNIPAYSEMYYQYKWGITGAKSANKKSSAGVICGLMERDAKNLYDDIYVWPDDGGNSTVLNKWNTQFDRNCYWRDNTSWTNVVLDSYKERTIDNKTSATDMSHPHYLMGVVCVGYASSYEAKLQIGSGGTHAYIGNWKITNYIYYDANGGSGSAIATQSKAHTSSVTLSSSRFIRPDAYQTGWNTKADGTGTHYDFGATYSAGRGVKLYAEWKPCLKASSLNLDGDKFNGTIKITWGFDDNSQKYYTNGKWFLFRKAEGETAYTKLAELAKASTSYTDKNLTIDVTYNYALSFVNDKVGTIEQPDYESITYKASGKLPKTFKYDSVQQSTSTQNGKSGILISWEPEKKGVTVSLLKLAADGKTLNEIYSGTSTSFVDTDVETFGEYAYLIKTTMWDTDFYSDTIKSTFMEMSKVSKVNASKGYYSNLVKISWDAEQLGTSNTRYVVSRKLLTDPKSVYADIYETLGVSSNYYYEDVTAQPGQYYYYKVTSYCRNTKTGKWSEGNHKESDGFNTSRGTIAGRVTFGSGTAVEEVCLRLTKNTNEDDPNPQFYALRSKDQTGIMTWTPEASTIENYLTGQPLSVQMWVNADMDATKSNERAFLDIKNQVTLYLKNSATSGKYEIIAKVPGASKTSTGILVKAGAYNNIILASDGKGNYTITASDGFDDNGQVILKSKSIKGSAIVWNAGETVNSMTVGGNGNTSNIFNGNIDDVRVWRTALAEKDILRNFNRMLSGTEANLLCYWPMDEGVNQIPFTYDCSKTNGVSNGNHAKLSGTASYTGIIPDADQLSLYGITDAQGNFTVRGVPFTGEGTSYSITPVKGVHEFNPTYVTRYISNNSLTHNAVDFTDVSSFPARGIVTYENTNIPVEGAYVYVDGNLASKDGEAIQTNADGEFKVDVPIGDHYITIKKEDHTFVNEGRYPADPSGVGTVETFTKEVSGLTFYDNTLVTVAGRVAGGDDENEKPVGFGIGKANIGQAKIVLDFTGSDKYWINAKRVTNGLTTSIEKNSAVRVFPATNTEVNSTATVDGGKNVITIMTDATNGEFAVQLPPLKYKATSITVVGQPSIDFSKKLPTLDASNPTLVHTDSTYVEDPATGTGEEKYFKYVALARVEHKNGSQLDVMENEDGSFGMESALVSSLDGTDEDVALYGIDDNGKVKYTFGYPVYRQLNKYKYYLHAYEVYENKQTNVCDTVPLRNAEVVIQNQYAAEAYVKNDGTFVEVEDNTFALDSMGRATYQFQAGLPNIQAPYTRGISISYNNAGTVVEWEHNKDFKAVVLGLLPTGTNFVTKGPDKVLMILRDPPGTASNATYMKGVSHTDNSSTTVRASENVGMDMTSSFGLDLTVWSGVGAGTIRTIARNHWELDFGIEEQYDYENSKEVSHTTTTTDEISTSDSPDFVGANGDLFIGASTNITIGTSNDVVIAKDEVNGGYKLKVKQNMVTSQEFVTNFNYTANYIENILIPNLQDSRDNLIQSVADVKAVARPTGTTPLYVSSVDREDERFGTCNNDEVWGTQAVEWNDAAAAALKATGRWDGPSYSVLLPVGYSECFSDEVVWYNSSIAKWERQLYLNEEAKVTAIENPVKYKKRNYSFDAGATVTVGVEKNNSVTTNRSDGFDINVSFSERWEFDSPVAGIEMQLNESVSSGGTWTSGEVNDTTTVMSFTLQEDGDDDYLSVDVYDAPDGHGPIFRTRGGATSAPFEDEVTTKYYRKGYVLQARTLQIEKPEIEIIDKVVTGVPSGKDAQVRVTLRNLSETGEDCYYGLWINPQSNPDGLQMFLDGQPIASGIEILVPAGEPMTKTLLVRQSNPDILEYKNVSLSFYSTSQPDDTGTFPGIYMDDSLSVYFQPSVTDIRLAASTSVVNTESEEPLMLSVDGYDYNQSSFQRIRLQYKGANDANFVTLKEYVKDAALAAKDPNLGVFTALKGTDRLTFPVDLRESDFTDQTYIFRALAVGVRNGVEIINSSDEIPVVRDMNRPQLIANPTPSNGILDANGDIMLTFNEDIRNNILTKTGNFAISGVMNEAEVSHDVALDITGDNQVKTQATINLADKSFAADMWLRYTSDGTLFQHGTSGNNFIVSTENGKLAVTIGGEKVVSTAQLPKNKWIFLTFNYDNSSDKPVVNASYAMDADVVTLLYNKNIRAYEGNGPLVLGGNGMRGRIQELALWNEARSMADALGDRSRTKSPYTNGLLGYWKFDEGHGTVATDHSRSRDFYLPAENAWYLNAGTNYVANLDGNTAIVVPSSVSTKADESYLLETWFRAEKSTGKSSILSSKNGFDIAVADGNNIEVSLNKTVTTVNVGSDLKDGQWHHLALNVLRSSGGAATLYIDGKARKSFAATSVPNLTDGVFILGGRYWGDGANLKYEQFLKGGIDEFRIWKGRFTKDYIENNMYSRLSEDQDGLAAYYPLETRALDQYGQVTTSSTVKDFAGNGLDILARTGASGKEVTVKFGENGPSLKTAPARENVQFDFVASERQISIKLLEEPSRIENCNIYLTVKEVKDVNGNISQPISWTIYAQQNQLKWEETDVDLAMQNGEKKTFTVEIANTGSTPDSWAITNLPSWLSVNAESGSIAPQATKKLTFAVEPNTAIGLYDATIYLVGNQNINAHLNVSLRVKGETPDWNPEIGEDAMVIVGQLAINGMVSCDTEDMVAAFNGLKCVGMAHPVYNARYDNYILAMNVYGNTEGDELTYKAYDASSGIVYPFIASSNKNVFTFNSCKQVGSFNNMTVFSPEDKIEQGMALDRTGWKWFSMYVTTTEDNSLSSVFSHTDGKVSRVKGVSAHADYYNGSWYGDLRNLDITKMYKLCSTDSFDEVATGVPASPEAVKINLGANGWSWIGYPLQYGNNIASAFADADPQEGDVVMSQSAFAIYTNGNWSGSLSAMTPGEGYKYFSNSGAKSFCYQKPSQSTHAKARAKQWKTELLELTYPENMAMIAVVVKDGKVITDASVSIYINKDLCGYSVGSDAEGRHFVTVGGDLGKQQMTAVISTEEGEYTIANVEQYAPDAILGSIAAPIIINLDEATSIGSLYADGDVERVENYNINGVRCTSNEHVYIQKTIFKDGRVSISKQTK